MIDERMRHHWAACLIGMAVAISIRIPTAAAPAVLSQVANVRPLRIKQWTGDG